MGWVGSGHTKWTQGQLCFMLNKRLSNFKWLHIQFQIEYKSVSVGLFLYFMLLTLMGTTLRQEPLLEEFGGSGSVETREII